jgi:hypothetical protein
MDVDNAVEELRFSLENIISEDKLLFLITERLATLRQSFSSHRSLFTPSHIEFLKSLSPIADQLQSFVELREELVDVRTLDDYSAMVGRLTDIKGRLAPFAVCQRVMKEVRELNERLPTIRERDYAKQEIKANTRIIDLEQNAPHCRCNHAMVIREGRHGYFGGCSRYPFCREATQLTPEQRDRLLF